MSKQNQLPNAASNRAGRRASAARIGGVLGSLILVSFMVVTGSSAVFNDTTDTSGIAFAAGDIELVDDDLGFVLLNVSDMEPGESVSDCIEVTYQGSIPDPSRVAIYSGGYIDSGDFDTYLNIMIEEGTGGTFGDCSSFVSETTIEPLGTLANFDTTHTDYTNGAGVWDPIGTPESKSYRITLELDSATPNAEQNESVTALTLTWEIQS